MWNTAGYTLPEPLGSSCHVTHTCSRAQPLLLAAYGSDCLPLPYGRPRGQQPSHPGEKLEPTSDGQPQSPFYENIRHHFHHLHHQDQTYGCQDKEGPLGQREEQEGLSDLHSDQPSYQRRHRRPLPSYQPSQTALSLGQPHTAPSPGQPHTAPSPGQPHTAPSPGQPHTAPSPGQPPTFSSLVLPDNQQRDVEDPDPLCKLNPHFRYRGVLLVPKVQYCSAFTMTGAALFSGAVTLVALALAVSTDYWLFMEEPYRVTKDDLAMWNITDLVQTETSVVLNLRSGLWNVCTFNLKEGNKTIPDICLHIDFTQQGTGRSLGAPICMTIVGAIRVAAPLPVAALILTVSAIVMSGLGSLKRNCKTVMAAVLYIIAGLCLAVGVVLFISAIYDELGYHSQTTGGPKDFRYEYGWSFYVAGSAFVSSELSAVMCVTLYLRHNARVQDMVRIIPGLHQKLHSDLQEAGLTLQTLQAHQVKGQGDADLGLSSFSW